MRWDRLDWAIRAGLFVVSSPIVVPTLIVARAGMAVIAASPQFPYDRGIVDFYNALVSVNNLLAAFYFPQPGESASAQSVAANREAGTTVSALAAAPEPEPSVATARRAQATATPRAAQHAAKPATQARAKKAGRRPQPNVDPGRHTVSVPHPRVRWLR